MSISTLSNRWLNRLYKSIAVLLVLFAVLISAMRLLLPYAQNYRIDLEEYINESYQTQVTIGALAMGWHKFGPTFVAKDVDLINTDNIKFTINQIDIKLDFWQSLRRQKLITSDFILTGSKAIVERSLFFPKKTEQDNTQEKITKEPAELAAESKSTAEMLEGLGDLFFEQINRFSLQDSQLIVNNGSRQRTFSISRLSWFNEGERRIAKADVIVDGLTTNNMKVILDIKGSNSRNMSGQLYVKASNLNITPWLDRVFALENDKTNSSVNFSAWLSIEKGMPEQLQVEFNDNEFTWQLVGDSQNNKQRLLISGGQLLLTHLSQPELLTLQTSPLEIMVNQHQWQPLTVNFISTTKDNSLYLSHINLNSIQNIMPLFIGDEETLTIINELSLAGRIDDIYWQKEQDKHNFSANFSQLESHFSQGIPGLKNAAGEIILSGEQLQIDIHAKQGALDFSDNFIYPLPYNTLQAKLNININNQGWQLNSEQLSLSSDELTFKADIGLVVPNNGVASMSLLASVINADVAIAHHYFPLNSMSESLVSYLKNGLISGSIDQAVVLFNGPLSSFPFEDKSGIFTVDAELSNTNFNFQDSWANITDFSANLNFTNNSMMISGRGGNLTGLDVTGVKVGIAELKGEGLLKVDLALVDVNPDHVTALMEQSPLKESVGETLKTLIISDAINGKFSLDLPLEHTDQAIAKGTINFKNNNLYLQTPEMNFTKLNGQLSFVNDVIKADSLQLSWLGLPLTLQVDSADKENSFSTKIDINASWQEPKWKDHVPSVLQKYLQGQLDWQGELLLNNHHDGGFSYQAKVNSSLKELRLNIPAPYNKTIKKVLPFSIQVSGQTDQSTITADLGKQLNFYGLLKHKSQLNQVNTEVYFSRAHLVLGNEKMLLPMDGFHITTGLEQVNFDTWQPFIRDIIASVNEGDNKEEYLNKEQLSLSAHPFIAKPERIRGSIGQLDVLGQSLTNVSFNFIDKQAWWLLQLNAKEARSEIKFYDDWANKGIDINADFLHLSSLSDSAENPDEIKSSNSVQLSTEGKKLSEALFLSFPTMRVRCDSCRVGNIDFGQLSFEVKRKDERLNLLDFTAKRKNATLLASGWWQHDALGSETHLLGTFTTKDIEFEMDKLGFSSTIKDSGGVLLYDLNWQGGPQNFTTSTLNGSLNGKIDDGYLAEVSDKGARVFSLLSLGSLARKLKLDFRDIFSDGMFYSKIEGDFAIKQGVLYTDNTKMKGAAGDLSLKGNTDLTHGLLDYRMSYKPNLTSSLPVLAWIATLNPVVFLTGLAINEVINATVISEFNFELTGDVDNPNLREVSRKSKNISVGQSSPKVDQNPNESTKKINRIDNTNNTNNTKDNIDG